MLFSPSASKCRHWNDLSLLPLFSLNGGNPSDYERRRGSSGTAVGGSHSPNAHMRAAASVDRLNMMSEGNSGRKLPSMPDSSMQRSPMKISGREGEIAALKRSNRRSASSHNLVNNSEGRQLDLILNSRSGPASDWCERDFEMPWLAPVQKALELCRPFSFLVVLHYASKSFHMSASLNFRKV